MDRMQQQGSNQHQCKFKGRHFFSNLKQYLNQQERDAFHEQEEFENVILTHFDSMNEEALKNLARIEHWSTPVLDKLKKYRRDDEEEEVDHVVDSELAAVEMVEQYPGNYVHLPKQFQECKKVILAALRNIYLSEVVLSLIPKELIEHDRDVQIALTSACGYFLANYRQIPPFVLESRKLMTIFASRQTVIHEYLPEEYQIDEDFLMMVLDNNRTCAIINEHQARQLNLKRVEARLYAMRYRFGNPLTDFTDRPEMEELILQQYGIVQQVASVAEFMSCFEKRMEHEYFGASIPSHFTRCFDYLRRQ